MNTQTIMAMLGSTLMIAGSSLPSQTNSGAIGTYFCAVAPYTDLQKEPDKGYTTSYNLDFQPDGSIAVGVFIPPDLLTQDDTKIQVFCDLDINKRPFPQSSLEPG